MGEMAAIQAINGAKSGWESGKCVTLQPTSSPAKRKGAQPSTRFQITAAPRAKSDGAPTGGSIRVTLSGGASPVSYTHLDVYKRQVVYEAENDPLADGSQAWRRVAAYWNCLLYTSRCV